LLELLSLLEARVVVQPNKVYFDVRKVLKRKKVSRDCMTLSEHGKFCIKRCKISSDVWFIYAPVSSKDNVCIENFKDSVTNNDSNTKRTSKLPISP
jgi:hypothetical protein